MKLSDYIKGLRKGKEAHRLEKESMKDPFLADAMDGYQQVEGDHARRVEQLHRQITTQTSKVRYRRAVSWSVAACLALGVGISSYFLFMKGEEMMPPVAFEEELLPSVVHSPEDELAEGSSPADTMDTVNVSTSPAPKNKEISSQVLAQTKHGQPEPVSVVDKQEQIIENAKEEFVVKEAEDATAKTEEAEESVTVAFNDPVATSIKLARFAGRNIIRGKVVDEQQEPVIGAVVTAKGTNIATLTNTEGQFELKTPKGVGQLTAQYIGYQPVEIPVDTINNLLIAMREDSQALNEVVVVGYDSENKSKKSVSATEREKNNRISEPLIGKSKYNKYLKKNLIRPSDEACKHVKGTVTLTFYIDKDGTPEQFTVVQGLCKSADQEAIRLVKEGPKWTPGNLPVVLEVKF